MDGLFIYITLFKFKNQKYFIKYLVYSKYLLLKMARLADYFVIVGYDHDKAKEGM